MGLEMTPSHGMLSRVAGNLFWIGRMMDRAENIARLADAARRIEALPGETALQSSEWTSALISAGLRDSEHMPLHAASRREAVHLLFFDRSNSSSVYNCFEQSRENARAVRTDITQEVWETLNNGWRDYRDLEGWLDDPSALSKVIDWIKSFTAQFRGGVNGTMLRNDGFAFLKLGQTIERVDSTARLVDVKYHVLLPGVDDIGSTTDRVQWQALLHAASAQKAYTHATRSDMRARSVANFLVLSTQFPRSIRFSVRNTFQTVRQLEAFYDQRADCHDLVAEFAGGLERVSIDDVISHGLHEFLTEIVQKNYAVADALAVSYGFAPPVDEGESMSSDMVQ